MELVIGMADLPSRRLVDAEVGATYQVELLEEGEGAVDRGPVDGRIGIVGPLGHLLGRDVLDVRPAGVDEVGDRLVDVETDDVEASLAGLDRERQADGGRGVERNRGGFPEPNPVDRGWNQRGQNL